MRRLLGAGLLAAALGCSGLTEGEAGVVAVDVRVPAPGPVVETGETIQLIAEPRDADGNVVSGVPITWITPDASIALDPATGQVTGVIPGQTARVQARSGSLSSALVSLQVISRADTLVVASDSQPVVAPGVTATEPLVVRLDTFEPAGPLANRPVIYEIVEPAFADPAQRTVELPGGVIADTVQTAADGTPITPMTLARVAGTTQPATAIVVVRAERTRGDPVPGSGQRFVVTFQ